MAKGTSVAARSTRLGKRDHAFVVIGPLLVFSTFFLKDVGRESLKDQVAALQALRDRFQAKQTALDIEAMIQSVDSGVIEINGRFQNPKIDARFNRVVALNNKILNTSSQMERDQLEGALSLANTLPDKGKLAIELKKGLSAISDFEQKLLLSEADFEKIATIDDGEKRMRSAAAYLDNQNDLLKIQTAIIQTGDAFTAHTIELADKERERKEWWYRSSNYACWALFILGWILGLVGVSGSRQAET